MIITTKSAIICFTLLLSAYSAFLQPKEPETSPHVFENKISPTENFQFSKILTPEFKGDKITHVLLLELPRAIDCYLISLSINSSILAMLNVQFIDEIPQIFSTFDYPPEGFESIELKESNDFKIAAYKITLDSTILKIAFPETMEPTLSAFEQDIQVEIDMKACNKKAANLIELNLEDLTIQNLKGSSSNTGPYSYNLFAHGLLMLGAWCIVFDLSLIYIRNMKGKIKTPNFQLIHSLLMWFAFGLTGIGILVKSSKGNQFGINGIHSGTISNLHEYGGWVVFYGTIGIILFGLILLGLSYIGFETKYTNYMLRLKRVHMFFGYAMYLVTRFTMVLGALLGGIVWEICVFSYIGAVLIAHVVITLKRNRGNVEKLNFRPIKDLTSEQRELVDKINSGVSREDLIKDYPKIRWVIYRSFILDLSGWIHPGGNYLIERVIGREVTQFLNGAFTIENPNDELVPHRHSFQAYKLIESCIIGTVQNLDGILLLKARSQSVVHDSSSRWNLVNKTVLTDTISRFDFTSDAYHVRPFVTKMTGLGRHFSIRFANFRGPTRTYTTALAMSDENCKLREAIIHSLEHGTPLNIGSELKNLRTTLPFFIKRYSFPNGFAKALHEVDLEDMQRTELFIEGPMGRGIELTPDSQGQYIIITAGTGIFLYADVLQYLLMKAAYDIFKSKGMNSEAQVIFDLGFNEKSLKNFSVKLIAAFAGEKEIYCLDMIRNLAFLSKKYQLGLFEAIISHGTPSEGVEVRLAKFDAEFLEKNIYKNSEKIYVCGPPMFNQSVPEELKKIGISESRITFI